MRRWISRCRNDSYTKGAGRRWFSIERDRRKSARGGCGPDRVRKLPVSFRQALGRGSGGVGLLFACFRPRIAHLTSGHRLQNLNITDLLKQEWEYGKRPKPSQASKEFGTRCPKNSATIREKKSGFCT